ncbi:MAG: biotin-dependent carboxyltransferase family protein [Gammaproteobacteria bacterium]|nr:biotin-dependent carboxyltransferase family protein [Gammaproteobacteria bacterium]
MNITVIKPGLQTTIQSGSRIGLRHLGVPANGAADPLSLALANKLVGNTWDAPALEAALLGPSLRFDSRCAFAIAGAHAVVTLNDEQQAQHETLFANAGDELVIGAAAVGARVYIAVAGGLDADVVLESASTNLQAGFGGHKGRALQVGDRLEVASGEVEFLQTPDEFRLPMSSSWGLRACPAGESDRLDETSRHALFDTNWNVDRRADRMGLRLDGPALSVSSDGRMPSAAVMPGTIQCPEDGVPYLLSVDAGTVGGYPRIAQVARLDRHVLGQLRPGDHVRLLPREPDEAVGELRAKLAYWREWLPDVEAIIL